MQTARLGRTRVEVSSLGFGGAPLGNLYASVDDDTALATVETAWATGVRYFDTAPHYGLGLSELRLGRALAGRVRDRFSVSTKVGRLLEPNPAPAGDDIVDGGFAVPDLTLRRWDFSRDGVRRSLDASLQRLGLDRVDIVYVHDPEDFMAEAIREGIPALCDLRTQGVIGAVGAGMNLTSPLRRIVADTDVDVVMLAGRWTLADRSGEPLLAECLARGVAVVAAAPFNSGLLAQPWPAADAHFDYGPASEEMLELAGRLATVCRAHNVELPHAAIRFPLRHPAVAGVVAGLRTPAEAAQAAAWMSRPLPDDLWLALDRVSEHGALRAGSPWCG